MGFKFGLKYVRKLTGAEVVVRVTQLFSILPAVCIFIISGYPGVVAKNGFFTVLFDWGVSVLPRWFVWLCSFVYRLTSKELLLDFAILVPMLAYGLFMGPLLRGKERTAVITRIVLAVLILSDLVIRVLPLPMNSVYGTAPSVFGFIVRLALLALTVLDLVFRKNTSET